MHFLSTYSVTNWSLIFLASFFIGLSKAGLKGIDMMNVTIMAIVFGGKASTGIVLPLLCAADIMAVIYYHRHAEWKHFWKLVPWMFAGILIGVYVGKDLDEIIFRITSKGYQPIMAHPERYPYYHHDLDKYENLKDRGCFLQMNINSLTGYYGKQVKQVAEKLFNMGLYDYVGTDMHHTKHTEVVERISQDKGLMALLQSKPLRNSLIEF